MWNKKPKKKLTADDVARMRMQFQEFTKMNEAECKKIGEKWAEYQESNPRYYGEG